MKASLSVVKKFGFAEWLCVLFIASAVALWIFNALPASDAAKEQLFAAAGKNEEAQALLDCELNGSKYVSNGDIPKLRGEVNKILASTDEGDLSAQIPGSGVPAGGNFVSLSAARYHSTDSFEGALRWILLEVQAHVVPVFGSLFAFALILVSRRVRSR